MSSRISSSCRADAHARPPSSTRIAEPREGGARSAEVRRLDVVDPDLAAGDGGQADEARDLDVVGADRVRAAVQARRRRDAEHVRADALDLRRRARRGSGRGPGRAARTRRSRSPSRPGASTAAMTAFSVAMTDASSRKICAPTSPPAQLVALVRPRSSAPSAANAWMCGSSRRRPITSPPGGGTLARPKRASSGPASRNEARIRLASSSSASSSSARRRATRTSFGAVHSASAPRSASSSTIVSTSRIRGTFVSVTGSSVSRHAARIGSAAFLLPAARTRPQSGRPPSMTNDSDGGC